jgi:hypothetical protein
LIIFYWVCTFCCPLWLQTLSAVESPCLAQVVYPSAFLHSLLGMPGAP